MPKLILLEPKSIARSVQDARETDDLPHRFRRHFRSKFVEELVATFNDSVGSTAWGTARSEYLVALRDALLATGLNCRDFISESTMAMDWPIQRRGDALVQVKRRGGR